MSDVAYSGEWDRYSKGIGEGGQVLLQTSYYKGVGICHEFMIQGLVHLIGNLCVVVRSEVGAVFSAFDLMTVYKVQVGSQESEAITLEALAALISLNHGSSYLQLLFPCFVCRIQL